MKNEDEKLNKNEQPLESNKSFDSKETNSNWIDTDTYASLQVTETDEKLVNTNKESLKLSSSLENNNPHSNWLDTDIYTPVNKDLDKENKKDENENVTKTNLFNQVKHYSNTILNKCRKDNRSLITGFLIVAALSCCITISVIN
ncbi:MAG: hypothetical protein UIL36_00280, partial [Turicibacter sp.]|nr:hypothetical protein [Turicibacter sp.]